MQSFVASAEPALTRLEKRLPKTFPERVFASIRDGVSAQAGRFTRDARET
jgi:hypothetical protein